MKALQVTDWLILINLIVGYGIRFYYERLTKSNTHKKSVNKTKEDIVVKIGRILFLIPFVYLFTPFLDFANLRFAEWVKWVGVAILTLGNIVLYLSHSNLGKNWSITLDISDKHTLTTTGIYQYVRHPMYLSFLLLVVGIFAGTLNILVGGSLVVWFLIMYLGRVKQEEQMMIDEFGDEYVEYMKKTGRLLPKLF